VNPESREDSSRIAVFDVDYVEMLDFGKWQIAQRSLPIVYQKAPDRILQYSDYSVQSLGSLKRSVDDFFGSKMFSPFDHGWMQWSEVNLTYKSQPSASTSCSQAKDSGVNGG